MNDIRPVILCGGSGTRLWPLSRRDHPKQFLNLIGEQTLFEATLSRIERMHCLPPVVVCGEAHRFTVQRQLDKAGCRDAKIIVEPSGRNTAPAIALAAMLTETDSTLLVLPSDHYVEDFESFATAVASAKGAALSGRLVTFGVVPDHASTAFGYLQLSLDDAKAGSQIFEVDRFVENRTSQQQTNF